MKSARKPRRVLRTILLVGEGASEVLFLEHLKRLYHQRGSGLAISIKNANGKGAGHVIDFAIRQSRNAAYDTKIALFDTDADWTDAVRKSARINKVQTLSCEPCFESVLLTIHQKPVIDRTTAQLKTSFATQFGVAASNVAMLQYFPKELLDNARLSVDTLNKLLEVMQQTISSS
jgi:hypothetical protein